MAITLPDTEDLDVFSHDETDIFSDTQKEQALQQAADLLFLATGVTEDATDATVLRIMSWGLLDMAWKLLISTENKTEVFSPYSSERIGSYSYSKQIARQAASGEGTGVEWFDAAVQLLSGAAGDSEVWWVTENVFGQPVDQIDPLDVWPTSPPDFFGR